MELPGLAIAALTGEPHEPDTPIRAMSSGAGEGLPSGSRREELVSHVSHLVDLDRGGGHRVKAVELGDLSDPAGILPERAKFNGSRKCQSLQYFCDLPPETCPRSCVPAFGPRRLEQS